MSPSSLLENKNCSITWYSIDMRKDYPPEVSAKLAGFIRNGDVDSFLDMKYEYVQEAEPFIFRNEDFSGINLARFSINWFEFDHCNFQQAKFGPKQYTEVKFTYCDLRGSDFHEVLGSFYFVECNARKILWDTTTVLGADNLASSCYFWHSQLDADFRRYLKAQGAQFKILPAYIERQYDTSENLYFRSNEHQNRDHSTDS